MVLYRANEQRLLDLLRSLALAVLVPYLQRFVRGKLARECRRRVLISKARLKEAVDKVVGIKECDIAASAHARLMGGFVKLFSPFVSELRQLRALRSAFEQWQRLEKELEGALHKYAISTEDEEEAAALGLVEAALIHAEKLKGVVKCTPYQFNIYGHARHIVDTNAVLRLAPLAEEALWLLDKEKMMEVLQEAERVNFRSDEVAEIKYLLALPEDKLVELQLKKAVELKDTTRVHKYRRPPPLHWTPMPPLRSQGWPPILCICAPTCLTHRPHPPA